MPKYLLLKHYTGGPQRHPSFVPISEWTEHEITAQMAFQRHVGELLRKRGEFVDVQALSPEGTYVRYGGPGMAPVTTDGPFPETKNSPPAGSSSTSSPKRGRTRLRPTSRPRRVRTGSRFMSGSRCGR